MTRFKEWERRNERERKICLTHEPNGDIERQLQAISVAEWWRRGNYTTMERHSRRNAHTLIVCVTVCLHVLSAGKRTAAAPTGTWGCCSSVNLLSVSPHHHKVQRYTLTSSVTEIYNSFSTNKHGPEGHFQVNFIDYSINVRIKTQHLNTITHTQLEHDENKPTADKIKSVIISHPHVMPNSYDFICSVNT